MVEMLASNLILNHGSIEYHWRKPWILLPKKGQIEKWSTLIPEARTFFLQDPFLELNIIKGFGEGKAKIGGKK